MINDQTRKIILHRRVCTIRPGRIDVSPARSASLAPLWGVIIGVGSFVLLIQGRDSLPLPLLLLLLMVSLVLVPLSSMGLVFSIIGANVIIDAKKQSATWQQGLLGLGIGTQELVPFWKIREIVVEEVGRAPGMQPIEELAQYSIALVKTSGKRLEIGNVILPRSLEAEAIGRAREVAQAIAKLVDKPLVAPKPRRRRSRRARRAVGIANTSERKE